MPGDRRSSVGETEEQQHGAIDGQHGGIVEATEGGTELPNGDGHRLVDHHLRGLSQSRLGGRLDVEAHQRRVDQRGRDQQDRDGRGVREPVGLDDQRRAWLAVFSLERDGDEIATLHSQPSTSSRAASKTADSSGSAASARATSAA